MAATSQVEAHATSGPDIRISELANGGPGDERELYGQDNFIEIANFGDEPADIGDWALYRCENRGSRVEVPLVAQIADVTLAPGEIYLFAQQSSTLTDVADELYSANLTLMSYGAWLEDDQGRVIDSVGVAPWTITNECAATNGEPAATQLPNDLDYVLAESHQRVAITGDVRVDFITARRTPGAPNATAPDTGVQPSDVLISEVTNGGPGGHSDDFIELANFGAEPVDISGWEIWRCWSRGTRDPRFLQSTVPAGTVLAPQEVFLAAHTSVDVPDGVKHNRFETSLTNAGFGALIEDPDGNVRDSVGVYESDGYYQAATDSACTQGSALPNRLDFGFGESYQRFQNTGDNAADFLKAPRSLGVLVIHDPGDFPDLPPFEFGPVRISELTHSGPGGHGDTFFELANYGDEPVSLAGWTVDQCVASGRREPTPIVPAIGDVSLEPGETFVAVRDGSPLHQAGEYDAVYTADLSGEATGSGLIDVGFGLIVRDGRDEVADKVFVNTSATEPTVYSACTNDGALVNIIDTEAGESFQRYQATGREARDFVPALRTPGALPDDLRSPEDFTETELAQVDVEPRPRPAAPSLVGPGVGDAVGADAELTVTAQHTAGENAAVTFRGAQRVVVAEQATKAFTGVAESGPPGERRPRGERPIRQALPLDGSAEPIVAEATDGFPYQRFELVLQPVEGDEVEVAWSGRSTGSNELQLYAWSHEADAWTLLDAAGSLAGGEISLIGTADVATMVRGRRLDVLVMDGPATGAPFTDEADEPNLAFKDPAEYDFSFGFLADTQELSHGFRPVYAEMNRWLVTNRDARKIAYTFHVGDVISKWTADQVEGQARNEFEFASNVMRMLEDAGLAYGVIPGNHDNKTGRSNDLFNEFFAPSRYEDQPWWGGSWREDDNQNHYDVMEIGGAKFLMMYFGYFGGVDNSPDEAIDWANDVIAAHPDHNVIVATHSYLLPDGSLSGPGNNRWNLLGKRYWEEVILPNENVFLALSGHSQGVALNIKRDVGGVEGRTVVEMMADYAGHVNDGRRNTGFMRLLQIDVDSKTMAVNTYSPTLDEHNAWEYDRFTPSRYDDSDDEFTVHEIGINDIYAKRVETDMIGVSSPAEILGTVNAAADEDATVTWTGLEPDTTYQWYAEARDPHGAVARSPLWTFTTAGSTSPGRDG